MGNLSLNKNMRILGVRVGEAAQCGSLSGNSSNLLNHLVELGYCNKIIATYPSNHVVRLYQLLSFDVNFRRWKLKSKIDLRFYNFLAKRALRQIRELNLAEFDASLQIGAWYNISDILNKLGNRNIIKCSFHDGNFVTMINSPLDMPELSKRTIRKVYEYEKSIYQKMDIIFPMSEWLKKSFIKDFNVPEEKLVVVGSGAHIADDLVCKEEKDYSKPYILFVGIDFKRKGGDVLLDAFKEVRKEISNAKLFIIGHKLKQDPPGVKSFGLVSKDTPDGKNILKKLYRETSLFVLPSLYDPFPIVFAEAMANKIPCIGPNNGSIPEIIEEGKCGFLVPVGNSRVLALKIVEFFNDPRIAKEMGDYCYKKYIENYTWEVVANKILGAIEKKMR